ncbi:MAG: hypothetical protein Q9218_004345 [Villophora microphyllina]
MTDGHPGETRRTALSPRPKGRENAKDTLCRNVTIYGHCRYEDKGDIPHHMEENTAADQMEGCSFSHDIGKAAFSPTPSENVKKRFNVDSPSFTPSNLAVNGSQARPKSTGISPKFANAAPFKPKGLTSRPASTAPSATSSVKGYNPNAPEWTAPDAQEFLPPSYNGVTSLYCPWIIEHEYPSTGKKRMPRKPRRMPSEDGEIVEDEDGEATVATISTTFGKAPLHTRKSSTVELPPAPASRKEKRIKSCNQGAPMRPVSSSALSASATPFRPKTESPTTDSGSQRSVSYPWSKEALDSGTITSEDVEYAFKQSRARMEELDRIIATPPRSRTSRQTSRQSSESKPLDPHEIKFGQLSPVHKAGLSTPPNKGQIPIPEDATTGGKTVTCFYWWRDGHCELGAECRYAHYDTGLVANDPMSYAIYGHQKAYSDEPRRSDGQRWQNPGTPSIWTDKHLLSQSSVFDIHGPSQPNNPKSAIHNGRSGNEKLNDMGQGTFQTDQNGDSTHSNVFDHYTPTPSVPPQSQSTAPPQINPYANDVNTMGSGAYFPGSTNYPQQLQHHLYAALPPHRDLNQPNQRTAKDLFISENLRQTLARKTEATLMTIPSYRLNNEPAIIHAVQNVQSNWKRVRNGNVVSVHLAFTNPNFGDSSLLFVTDFHPLAETLAQKHFTSVPRYNNRYSASHVPEHTLWSYIVQIANGLKAIHSTGLAARVIDASKILLTGQNRIRLNACAVLDVVQADARQALADLQRLDLQLFGKLIIALGSNNMVQQNQAKAMEVFSKSYSPRLKEITTWLLDSTMPDLGHGIDKFLSMIASDLVTAFDSSLHQDDALETALAHELENSRLVRLITKINFINERPEYEHDRQWAEHGNRFVIRLFRDYVFHQVDANGNPVLDLVHVLQALNRLDAGSEEKVCLMTRDEESVVLVSFKEVRSCVEGAWGDLVRRSG